jgi:hypothetical protein
VKIAAKVDGLAMWRYSVFCQLVAAAKFINKCSLFILSPGFIRRLEPKQNSEQKVEHIFVGRHIAKPPVGCCIFYFFGSLLVEFKQSNNK